MELTKKPLDDTHRSAPRVRKEIGVYLGTTYALALTLALVFPHQEIGALLTILVPGVAVAVAVGATTSHGERGRVWLAVGFGRPRVRYLLHAIAGPVGVAAFSFGFAVALGVVRFPDPGPGIGDEAMNVLITTVIFTFVLLGEEIGWRGYLLPRFGELTSGRPAALLTGACHAAFHLPLLVLTTTYQGAGSRWFVVPLVMVTLTLAGAWYAWLRVRSGSIWPVTLSHSAFNGVMESAGGAAIASSAATMAYVTTETGFVTLIGIGCLSGYLLLARPGDFTSTARRTSP